MKRIPLRSSDSLAFALQGAQVPIPGGGNKDLTCYTAKQNNNNKNLSKSRINLLKKKNGDDSQASFRTKRTEELPHQSQPSVITSFLSPCTFCCPLAPGNTGELLRGPGPIPGQARLQPTHQFSDHIAVPYLTPSSWAPQASPAPGPHLLVLREPRLQKHPG